MTLRLVEKNPEVVSAEVITGPTDMDAGTRHAPNAPKSSGTLPLELATHLRHGEALVWWGIKDSISLRPVAWVSGVCLFVLGLVSALYPAFWLQPFDSVWRPLAVLFAPAALVLVREATSLRATLVTDNAVIDVPRRGAADRVSFNAVRRVRRDLLTGGIRLDGAQHRVRIPHHLADDARQAIASQRRGMVRASKQELDDPIPWMP